MWSLELEMELMMVVSEMGEQWSPKIAPSRIDPKVIVSDETREALLVALRTAHPETSDGKSDGDS